MTTRFDLRAGVRLPSVLLLSIAGPLALARLHAAAPQDVDRFGVEMLQPTTNGGREWFAEWETERTVAPYKQDPQDALFRNSEGTLTIKGGIATAPPGQTRFFVLTPKDQTGKYTAPQWQNVEMTIYVK